jgi:hypothetical protein
MEFYFKLVVYLVPVELLRRFVMMLIGGFIGPQPKF